MPQDASMLSAAGLSATRTLDLESEGLQALRAALDDQLRQPFGAAVATLAAAKGRVIVTGIGKSGHVGQKLAATFASTGTPAFFVHPSEASHGDLGMITPRRRDRRHILVGRKRRARQHPHLLAPLQGAADRHHLARRVRRSASRRTWCWSCRAPRRPARTGWRRPPPPPCSWRIGDCLAIALLEEQGLHRARLQGVPPGRLARRVAQVRRRRDAHGRPTAAGRRGHAHERGAGDHDAEVVRLPRRGRRQGQAGRRHHRRRPAAAHGRRPAAARAPPTS